MLKTGVVVEDSHKPPDSSYWSQVSGLFERQPSARSTRGSLLHACSSSSSSLAVAVMGMAEVQQALTHRSSLHFVANLSLGKYVRTSLKLIMCFSTLPK